MSPATPHRGTFFSFSDNREKKGGRERQKRCQSSLSNYYILSVVCFPPITRRESKWMCCARDSFRVSLSDLDRDGSLQVIVISLRSIAFVYFLGS